MVGRAQPAIWMCGWSPTPGNAPRVLRALATFGAPLTDVTEADFARPGVVLQIGVPPRRIDVLTQLTALDFADAWTSREPGRFGDLAVDFVGREDFVANKRASGRPKDLLDLALLEEADPQS